MQIKTLVSALALLVTGGAPLAAADWSNTSVSYLQGKDYINPFLPDSSDDKKFGAEIMTLEHVSGNAYGDNFFFVDILPMNAETPGFYMEWAPRFSSSKILGQEYGGMLSDVLLSGQINVPSTSLARKIYLYGAAIDLALPSFKFFQSNFYIRDDLGKDGTTYQITLVWGMEIIDKLTFGGFLDYAGEEGDKNKAGGLSEANLLMQPQLLYEAVPSLQVGLEYQYWQNKFGVDGETESVPQIMAKWNF